MCRIVSFRYNCRCTKERNRLHPCELYNEDERCPQAVSYWKTLSYMCVTCVIKYGRCVKCLNEPSAGCEHCMLRNQQTRERIQNRLNERGYPNALAQPLLDFPSLDPLKGVEPAGNMGISQETHIKQEMVRAKYERQRALAALYPELR